MRESESPGPLAIVVGSLLTVDTVNGSLMSFRVAGTEHHYMAAPFPLGHDEYRHKPVRAGDILRVLRNPSPQGTLLVRARCGCRLYIGLPSRVDSAARLPVRPVDALV